MILRRTMLDEIGLLDEDLYTYFDDADICLRAARAGWETWFVPQSRVIHLEGASTGLTGGRERPCPLLASGTAPVLLKNHGRLYTAWSTPHLSWAFRWRLHLWIQRRPESDPPLMLIDSDSAQRFLRRLQRCRLSKTRRFARRCRSRGDASRRDRKTRLHRDRIGPGQPRLSVYPREWSRRISGRYRAIIPGPNPANRPALLGKKDPGRWRQVDLRKCKLDT